MKSSQYQICSRCVMDTTASEITFNEKGECNFCIEFLRNLREQTFGNKQVELEKLIKKIKEDGKGKEYDCIFGVSGGIDSSYGLYLAKNLGLRILAVHMDNGWDSELSANNIANLVKDLGIDLYTHVIDWEEYKDLMESFFKSNVIDVEILYDNAMLALNYQQASKFGIRYILAGTNMVTEGFSMSQSWNWFKFDKKNIRSIQKRFGKRRIITMPMIGVINLFYYLFVKRIKWISFLDYFDYSKNKALNLLQTQFGYKPYLYKHYESVFTRFYQGYILPKKFGIDKRRAHLSNLICSGQMNRDKALKILEHLPYSSQRDLDIDIEYFLKKMGWTREKLDTYLKEPEVPHYKYGTEKYLFYFLKSMRNFLKALSLKVLKIKK